MDRSPLALAALHFASLYELDARGRIAALAPPAEGAAPRLHVVRTALGTVWRMRCDLPPALVRRLSALAGREGPWRADAPLERAEFLRRALADAAPVAVRAAGIAFAGADASMLGAPSVAADVRPLAPGDAARAHGGLGDEAAHCAPERAPVGAFVDGALVAVCRCASRSAREPAQARVATAEPFRGRGLGAAVLAGWARAVLAAGGVPLLRAGAGDRAARALALRARFVAFGDEHAWD